MMNDFMNLLFKTGIPYDAERNEFRVRPEDIPRIEHQRELDRQEQQWMNRPHWNNHDDML